MSNRKGRFVVFFVITSVIIMFLLLVWYEGGIFLNRPVFSATKVSSIEYRDMNTGSIRTITSKLNIDRLVTWLNSDAFKTRLWRTHMLFAFDQDSPDSQVHYRILISYMDGSSDSIFINGTDISGFPPGFANSNPNEEVIPFLRPVSAFIKYGDALYISETRPAILFIPSGEGVKDDVRGEFQRGTDKTVNDGEAR